MFKRILSGIGRGIAANRWTFITIAVGAMIVGYFTLTSALRYDLANQPTASSVVTCDQAVVLAISGNPGDDQQVVDCFVGNPRGPVDPAEVAQVRTLAGPPKQFAKVGEFFSDRGLTSDSPATTPRTKAVIYVVYDSYPESVYTVFLSPDGHIATLQN